MKRAFSIFMMLMFVVSMVYSIGFYYVDNIDKATHFLVLAILLFLTGRNND